MINKKKNYGFIKPEILAEDYIFGAEKVPLDILQSDSTWLLYLPLSEQQRIGGVETFNCTSFGTLNCLEILIHRKYGIKQNYSDRAVGIVAGTQPPGNTPVKIIETIRKEYSMVKEEFLPFSINIASWQEYYSPKPLTINLQDEGKKWLQEWEVLHEWVFVEGDKNKKQKLIQNLKYSPLGVSVDAWNEKNGIYYKEKGADDNHWTVLYAYDKLLDNFLVFDTYERNLKILDGDYDFGFAKRYWINRKKVLTLPIEIVEKKTSFQSLLAFLNSFIAEIFK